MSTREMAYSIIDQFTDEELEGFVSLFSKVHPPEIEEYDQAARDEAFNIVESIRKKVNVPPDFDPEKARDEYFKEKYGI